MKKVKQPRDHVGVMKIVLDKIESTIITPDLTAHIAFGMPYIGEKGYPIVNVVLMGVDSYCAGGIYPLQMQFVSTGDSFYPAHAPAFQFLLDNGVFGTKSAPCISNGSYHQSGDGGNEISSHPISYVLYSILEVMRDGGQSAAGGIAIERYDSETMRKVTIGRFATASRSKIINNPSLRDHCRQTIVESWNIYRRNVVVWAELIGCSNMELKQKELAIPGRFMTYLEPYPTEEELKQIRVLFATEYMPFSEYWAFLNELGAVEEINALADSCRDRRREWLNDWKSNGGDGSDEVILKKFRRIAWGRGGHDGPLYFPIPKPGEEPEWIRPGRGEIIIQSAIKLNAIVVDDFEF